jgi:hypothetical protein
MQYVVEMTSSSMVYIQSWSTGLAASKSVIVYVQFHRFSTVYFKKNQGEG